jgi:hypothetical protein
LVKSLTIEGCSVNPKKARPEPTLVGSSIDRRFEENLPKRHRFHLTEGSTGQEIVLTSPQPFDNFLYSHFEKVIPVNEDTYF